MPKLIVEGRTFEYPTVDTFTFEEADVLLDATGIYMGELLERLGKGDARAVLGMMVVAKYRADGDFDADYFRKLKVNDIEYVPDAVEEEDDDPLLEGAEVDEAPAAETTSENSSES